MPIPAGQDRVQSGEDAIINIGIVQLVLAIIAHEVEQGFLYVTLIVRITQGPSHQHWCTIPDIAGNHLIGQFRLLIMAQAWR